MANSEPIPAKPLRPSSDIMHLSRMGSFFPTRLSFMRTVLRHLSLEKAQISRPIWNINQQGFGHATYAVKLGTYTYTLVAFSNPLEPEDRTDRVIAQAWDMAFVLYDGVPTLADIERLKINAPKQEAGRFEESELILCRANRSVRLFNHVVDCLSNGRQPDHKTIEKIGYLARTTAVYGNGKFGIADREIIANRPGLEGPFQAEMLTVWLVRGFTHHLVEYIAANKNPANAIKLDANIKRNLGIGNATGLGMAPFLVSHPQLINQWMLARETALARSRAIASLSEYSATRMENLMQRVSKHLVQWNVEDKIQMERIVVLRKEWVKFIIWCENLPAHEPLDKAYQHSRSFSLECQELVVALLIEIAGELNDDLPKTMSANETFDIDSTMLTSQLGSLINDNFCWALDIDFTEEKACHQFWYVSEEKLEPRLGIRNLEPGADKETPQDIARQIKALNCDLKSSSNMPLANFLALNPHHRNAVRRVQNSRNHPYSEIQDNLIDANCRPIDMLRCKLSFFGAAKFDPKSDRWTRINMFQGAPLFDEISGPDADDWWLPVLEETL